MSLNYFLLIISLYYVSIESARILAVFPSPQRTHHKIFHPFVKELISRGHQVVTLTTFPIYSKGEAPENITEIELPYKEWLEGMDKKTKVTSNSLLTQVKASVNLTLALSEMQFNSEAVLRMLDDKNSQFDLLIIEAYVKLPLMLTHRYKAPLILLSSFGAVFGNYEAIGAPVPFLYPASLRQKFVNLTLLDNISEMYSEFTMKFWNVFDIMLYDKLIKKFYQNAPDFNELYNNIHMLLLNTHILWDENRPVPQSAVFMYGIHHQTPQDLPQDLQSHLDASINGVIYISFGTNVKTTLLPPEKIQIMLRVLSRLPYDILWKWDQDEMPGKPKNVKLAKWFPQADLLKHPKVKAFITQAGLQSTDEAIAAGVPVIGIPIIFDQWLNAEKYVRHGVGMKLDLVQLTEEEFKHAVIMVIEDESYRRNMVTLRSRLYDQPQPPLERALWWTEHVLRHGGARHLRAPAANMSWAEFFEVELFFMLFTVLFTIIITIGIIFRALLRCILQLNIK